MLTDVADDSNMESIVEELAAYVTDIDVEIAQRSVRSVGQIACKLASAREHCISIVRSTARNSRTATIMFAFKTFCLFR